MGALPHVNGNLDRSAAGRVVATRPQSDTAESFRTLRTAIHFGLREGQAKTILVTSPLPVDGKSTVASNLAIAMAQADQSVLLIEADFRRPSQKRSRAGDGSRLFRRSRLDDESLEAAIVATGVKGLSVLPCGPTPSNPAELVNCKAFCGALEELSQRFDKIVIDASPVIPVANARSWAPSRYHPAGLAGGQVDS